MMLKAWHHYYTHFIDDKTEVWRSCLRQHSSGWQHEDSNGGRLSWCRASKSVHDTKVESFPSHVLTRNIIIPWTVVHLSYTDGPSQEWALSPGSCASVGWVSSPVQFRVRTHARVASSASGRGHANWCSTITLMSLPLAASPSKTKQNKTKNNSGSWR